VQQSAQQRHFNLRLPEIAAAQVSTLLRHGDVAAAGQLTQQYELPLSRARVLLAQGDAAAALAVLGAYREHVEARGWQDEQLKAMVLQALARRACGERDAALQLLGEALALAEPGGFIRLLVDEGELMHGLLQDYRRLAEKQPRERTQPSGAYLDKLLAAFASPGGTVPPKAPAAAGQPQAAAVEPLSPRELDILRLIAQGLSNREIGARLFLALNTVKGHNRVIFDKLQVERRTEAIARARELGLL
jgi:LuxR family transcriptional regulator, maltose regulon positive regulatory protein